MGRKIFHLLRGIGEVEGIVSKYVKLEPAGVEEVSLEDALGRVLAEDVYAPLDHPPFDRSEVDGYAVRAEDTFGADEENPAELQVIGSIRVGEQSTREVKPGCTLEIATGAMLPRGANAVVMEEHTHRDGDRVLIYKSVAPGQNVATAGSDISMGDLLLRKGTRLDPRSIGVLAAMGVRRVRVYRRVRVAVFSTGDEVVEPGEPIRPGQVYDVNSFYMISALREMGVHADFAGHLPDNFDVMRDTLAEAIRKYDVVITSGGTSAGAGDLVYRVIDNLGKPGVLVHGLRIKPGKPTVIGVVEGKLFFGMPGFPLSCAMVFDRIVKPLIAKLAGLELPPARRVRARFPYRLRAGGGRAWLLPVSLVDTGDGYAAYPVSLSSGAVSPLLAADGYVFVPENKEIIEEGEIVEATLFTESVRPSSLVVIGSHDIALSRILAATGLIRESKIIPVGSLRGWHAAARGEADIAPTHLLDEETGEYNVPFIRKLGLQGKVRLVRGYKRRVGLLVRKGNPKNIRGIEDLLRSDIAFVNRVKGSGIRTLLDIMLRRIAREKGIVFDELVSRIKGYTYEVRTHTAVAAAVAQGRADVGLAAEIAARLYNLDFIPLSEEIVDFIIPSERMEKQSVKNFIESLRTNSIRELLNSLPGYDALPETGRVIA